MAQIIGYMAHDAACNMEQPLDSYDAAYLSRLAADGIIFVAVYDDGSRCVVSADEVSEPEPQMNGITLCTPKYVNDRTTATIAVFDALAAIVDPESAVATTEETGDETEVKADPVEVFRAALAALRRLETGGDE